MNGAFPLFSCLGPLPKGGFEAKLDQHWWKYLFSSTYNDTSLYLKTDGDVVEDPEITRAEIDVFSQALQFEPKDRILDLCCGQGRHSLELAQRGFTNVSGFDFSNLLISTARERAAQLGLGLEFTQGDARQLPYPPSSFDKVLILGNSIGYFHSESDEFRVLSEVARVLRVGGKLVIDLADGDFLRENFQPRSWEWVDGTMFVCREREMSSDNQRLISREIISLTDKGVIKDQLYSERLFNFSTMTKLLHRAGFTDVQNYTQFSPDSKRDQDLGMMEQRIIVVATVGEHLASPTFTPQPTANVSPNERPLELPSRIFTRGADKGLQATRNLKAGEVVERFVGPIMSYAEIPAEEKPYVVWAGPEKWLIPTTDARYINHSCDPNCGVNTEREIVARRPIPAGAHLTISYNVSTQDGFWDPIWSFNCDCGVYNCQKVIDKYVVLK